LLRVTLAPDLGAVARVEWRRETPVPEQIELLRGEVGRIDLGGAVPANLRGRVRTDAIDLDAPAMRVPISRHRSSAVAEPASLPAAVPDAARSPSRWLVPATTLIVRSGGDPNRQDACRLTVYEPMFALVGAGIDSNAQFQLSFKLRLYEPADKNSRRLQDNLYFGYTQSAFWDLTSDSKPFVDTNCAPSFFYQVPRTDWRIGGQSVGLAVGYEHESNDQD
jgi:hypothetical protein